MRKILFLVRNTVFFKPISVIVIFGKTRFRISRVVKFRGFGPISEIGFSRRTNASDQG